jgi:hypothetical protein
VRSHALVLTRLAHDLLGVCRCRFIVVDPSVLDFERPQQVDQLPAAAEVAAHDARCTEVARTEWSTARATIRQLVG